MNIYDYFKQQLGVAPDDDTLQQLSVDSVCGEDCKKAIDAAHALRHHLSMAYANHEDQQRLTEMADHIITTYWRG